MSGAAVKLLIREACIGTGLALTGESKTGVWVWMKRAQQRRAWSEPACVCCPRPRGRCLLRIAWGARVRCRSALAGGGFWGVECGCWSIDGLGVDWFIYARGHAAMWFMHPCILTLRTHTQTGGIFYKVAFAAPTTRTYKTYYKAR